MGGVEGGLTRRSESEHEALWEKETFASKNIKYEEKRSTTSRSSQEGQKRAFEEGGEKEEITARGWKFQLADQKGEKPTWVK